MDLPFKSTNFGNIEIREFSVDTPEDEYVWHRDAEDREILLIDGDGWKLQLDDELPKDIVDYELYYIPKGVYHRLIKGTTDLTLSIRKNP